MPDTTSVFLIGPMGAGKSTIGRLLSFELEMPFVDSDKEIEDRCGANIPWIFDKEGEAGFRKREEQVIANLSQQKGILLATGGGVVMNENNRRNLASNGTVVYLRTSVEHQLIRTTRDKGRPLLQQDNPEKVLRDLFEIRDPLYKQTADVIVQTDSRNPKSVIQEILKNLAKFKD